jgi:hypothetical protein
VRQKIALKTKKLGTQINGKCIDIVTADEYK